MRIEVLYLRIAPTTYRLRTVLREEGMNVEVLEVEVENAAAAEILRFIGSPTVRINGLDIETASRCLAGWASPAGVTQAVCHGRR